MDNIEMDFHYDQKIEDVKVQLELLVLEAFSSALNRLMDNCKDYNRNTQNDDIDWPF
jgi:hypothetical protein